MSGRSPPEVMAQLPFTKHGFTIRPVGEIAAALQSSGLRVEQRRIDEKPMPRYLFVGRRTI
jgi:arsenite methyltransferase